MKKSIRKLVALALTAAMTLSLASCGNTGSKTASKVKKTEKVAVILSGPITDMAWNQTAYNGIKKIQKLGAQISYQENVPVSSLADSINTYANGGYDLVFIASNVYENAAKSIVGQYPNTEFVLINGAKNYTKNMVSYQIADDEQGFMMGAIAALTTKSKNIGFVGGSDITAIENGKKGFIQGAAYADKSVKVNAALTGSMDDVNQAKQTAKAMIDAGADVVAPMCNQSSIGVLQAAEESGGKSTVICSSTDQENSAPKSAIIGIGKDTSIAYVEIYKKFLAGKLDKTVQTMGANDGVVFLTKWYSAAKDIPQSTKDKVKQIYDQLAAGKITISLS